MIKNSRMHTIVKQVSRFNNYKPRSIAQQKDIRVYNTGNETPVSAITRNVTDGTGLYPEHSRDHLGLRLVSFISSTIKRACGRLVLMVRVMTEGIQQKIKIACI